MNVALEGFLIGSKRTEVQLSVDTNLLLFVLRDFSLGVVLFVFKCVVVVGSKLRVVVEKDISFNGLVRKILVRLR